ncbi:MAG TPA: bifunctional diaminohydroxyphosphoribosylaminopyrimidine deaminase/5-amino-6-(5-phosphoribosylamino)uracil reductase RibD [Blastocatellia bacterium]|nr:bifunctional diaminohydroxyphosphoribosylaminopyrimidine deaminase/5-amino-6-(5-phosphoribosylamino)uracil reductase RibD [Blastocatellia bacterium]
MKRAIELARRGAGLVSPNPMVGAVLVNEGRVVGEGYHRYDRLNHAESYAIEAAGERARGATMYCNLEPCCHHGRTPPCTDALIAAGISRAMIAVKDPDHRVNGRGIEQLREAGIDVEVGLLEERALRLNETYFKFITVGTPFIHGVIEYPLDSPELMSGWLPSDQFLQAASEYDALLLGGRAEVNKIVAEAAVRRERHRELVVVASEAEPSLLKDLRRRSARKIVVVPIEIEPAEAGGLRKVVRLDEGVPQSAAARSELGSVLATLARMQVTSVIALPGLFDLTDVSNFAEFDKLTMVLPGGSAEQGLPTQWVLGNLEFDLDDGRMSESAGYTELTGYPSLRGVA